MKKKGILIGILALIIIIFLGILYFNDDTRIYKDNIAIGTFKEQLMNNVYEINMDKLKDHGRIE